MSNYSDYTRMPQASGFIGESTTQAKVNGENSLQPSDPKALQVSQSILDVQAPPPQAEKRLEEHTAEHQGIALGNLPNPTGIKADTFAPPLIASFDMFGHLSVNSQAIFSDKDFNVMNEEQLMELLNNNPTPEEITLITQRLFELDAAESQKNKDKESNLERVDEKIVNEEMARNEAQILGGEALGIGQGHVAEIANELKKTMDTLKNILFPDENGQMFSYDPKIHDLNSINIANAVFIDTERQVLRMKKDSLVHRNILEQNPGYQPGQGQTFQLSMNGVVIQYQDIEFLEEEEFRELVEAFIAHYKVPEPVEEEIQKKQESKASSHSRQREIETAQSNSGSQVQQPRTEARMGSRTSSSTENSKAYYDRQLEKYNKKLEIEQQKLEKVIAAYELLQENIKRDIQMQTIKAESQKLEDFSAQNEKLNAQYEELLEIMADINRNFAIPLPLRVRFKEIQIHFVRLGEFIPKERTGTSDKIDFREILALKKQILTMMSEVIQSIGTFSVGTTSQGQSPRASGAL